MLDVDHFKSVNDAYEHPTGDKALCLVAETLLQNKRDYDLVGRWGGEEFLALLPNTSLADARKVAKRFRTGIDAARLHMPDSVKLTIRRMKPCISPKIPAETECVLMIQMGNAN
ncbi:MAG: GGDEF domain-containing protein [Deltaproteobacteria bacterium]|nr:GGDEF domain-containing protein [Deltaproteobacteria bacterium]